jgi:hypothetical protein
VAWDEKKEGKRKEKIDQLIKSLQEEGEEISLE